MRKHVYFLSIFIVVICRTTGFTQTSGFPPTSIALKDLSEFTAGDNWKIVGDVSFDFTEPHKTWTKAGTGIAVNQPADKNKYHLISKMKHGDIDLELDFMMDKNSNAGVYLQGRYEIQMFDSWCVPNVTASDCGSIYERWDDTRPVGRKGYQGHAPAQNVSKAPGLWQHYRIIFRAPRFNEKGEKIENARFVKVEQNGVVIHENIEVTGPTRAAYFQDEQALGPLMIQGDHGPVAIKNITYRNFGEQSVTLSDLQLKSYEGRFKSLNDFQSSTPTNQASIELIAHQGTESNQHFAGIISGKIHIPKAGKYFFALNLKWIPGDTNPDQPNGGGELQLNNAKILSLDGKSGGIASATINLDSGIFPFILSYYKTWSLWYARSNDIELGVESPEIQYTILNGILKSASAIGAITVPVTNEPVMQRCFINHANEKKTHVIAVGLPGKVNYAFDLATGSLLKFWRGNFIETTLMWHERGEQQLAQPLGSVIELSGHPSLASLESRNADWPKSTTIYSYTGYDIDKKGLPVFKYSLANASVKEVLDVAEDGKKLSHTFSITNLPQDIWCSIAEGSEILKMTDNLYAVNHRTYYIELSGKEEVIIRKTNDNTFQLLTLIKATNNSGSFKYSIVW